MKLSKQNLIERAANTDRSRLHITAPCLKGDKLIATTGRVLMVLPVEREPQDVDGYISPEALAAARKICAKLWPPASNS